MWRIRSRPIRLPTSPLLSAFGEMFSPTLLSLERRTPFQSPARCKMQFFLPKRLEVRFSSRLVSSPPRALIFNIPASERFPSMTQSRMLSTSALLTFGARATFAALRVVGLSAAPVTLPTRCPQRFPPPVPPTMSQDTVKCPLGRAWNKSPTAKNCFPS